MYEAFADRCRKSVSTKQLIREGTGPVGGTSDEFGQFIQREYEKWKLIVLEAGARAD